MARPGAEYIGAAICHLPTTQLFAIFLNFIVPGVPSPTGDQDGFHGR